MKAAIAYIRVSTGKQGKSGLGLEAQQATIQRFADQEGLEIVQSFTEVQSGKDDDPGCVKTQKSKRDEE
jgi:DNA invertase Pin-like site-specific DNA recombinase